MIKTQTKPQYVNLQATAVQVFDEKKHVVTVLPWSMRRQHNNRGTFVVEGAHYQQFVSGRGPLYPFPVDQAHPAGPLGETTDSYHARLVAEAHQKTRVDGLQAAADRGKIRIEADVVRAGAVVGETQEAFIARLRSALVGAGIGDEDTFRKAPRADLLKVTGITDENLPRVRELGALLFPAEVPQEPELPVKTYTRAKIDSLSRKQMVALIQEEGFDIPIDGTAAGLRASLIEGLTEYGQLVD